MTILVIPSAGTVRSSQMDVGWRWFTFNTYLKEERQNMVTARYGAVFVIMEKTVTGLR